MSNLFKHLVECWERKYGECPSLGILASFINISVFIWETTIPLLLIILVGSLFRVPVPGQTKPRRLACPINLNHEPSNVKMELINFKSGTVKTTLLS